MDKKILELQSPSTRKALERPESEDIAWRNRPIPENYLAVPEAKTKEELIGARSISFEEAKIHQYNRYMRGRRLAEVRCETGMSSVTPAKRELAISAFLYVRQKFSDLMQWAGLASQKEAEQIKKHEK